MDNKWDICISKFRNCGGIAENIYQKVSKNSRGIFPVNSKVRSRIFVPKKLLINREHVYLDQGRLRIKNVENYSKEVIDFFSFYQDNFSWGRGGKESTEAFEEDLALFSEELKYFLKQKGIIDINRRHINRSEIFILQTF